MRKPRNNRKSNRVFLAYLGVVIGIVISLLINGYSSGYDREISIEKDASVYEYSPDTNFGSDTRLRIGNYYSGKASSYYHFNIASLQKGWRELTIVVRFNCGSSMVDVGVNFTYDNWEEDTITWNNKPSQGKYRGHILCDGFNFNIPLQSENFTNGEVTVCLYGKGGSSDGYIQGISREGSSDVDEIPFLLVNYRGFDPVIVGEFITIGIIVCIVIATIIGIVIIIIKKQINSSKKIRNNEHEAFVANWRPVPNWRPKFYEPSPTIEKKINDYLTLKMVHGRTYIYVKGKRFIQCMRLILDIPKEDVPLYDEVDSIDEAATLNRNYNRIFRGPRAIPVPNQEYTITPEQEFWGHCSNIQAWVEHDYDTRILMSNISFPLLRELVNAGDPKASRIFKEEIALRLESGHPTVVEYLLNQRYLNYFSLSEFQTIINATQLIKGLSSYPRSLVRFLMYCSARFPSLVEDILIQIIKLPEGKNILFPSINISDTYRMPIQRPYFQISTQYLHILKRALESLFRKSNEQIKEVIMDYLQEVDSRLESVPRKNTILIVDGNPDIVNLTEKFLRIGGFDTITSYNAKEAMKMVEENHDRIALILLEIMIPGKSGYYVLEEIKSNEKYREILVVLHSAKSFHEDIQKGKNLGADDYIIKPISGKELLKRIIELVDKKELEN